MANYDGHMTKRQRTDDSGHGVQSGSMFQMNQNNDAEDNFDDPHKTQPSPVIHVRGLVESAIEADIVNALQQFGSISYVIMMPKRRQALVEFDSIQGARNCVTYAAQNQLFVNGQAAYFNYSTSQRITRPGGPDDTRTANHILLFTVLNPQYPITVDVMHTICSPYGQVQRIVIFRKNGVQSMVEFENVDSAKRAKQSLNGADIYSGCCTLKIEYAKPDRLNVIRNDQDSWDYTNPNLSKDWGGNSNVSGPGPRSAPLLQEPRYESRGMGGLMGGMGGGGGGYSGGYDQEGFDGYNSGGHGGQFGGMQQDRYAPRPPMGRDPGFNRGGGYNEMGPMCGMQSPSHGAPPQQGCVLMVYGLNMEKVNCDKLFNLFCLYGNVIRIKFLKSKDGSAMVQLGDGGAVDRAMQNLNSSFFFGSKMQMAISKQAFLQDVPNPHELIDGTSSFKDYMGNRNNRFTTPEAASKNRIQTPSKILHYSMPHPMLLRMTSMSYLKVLV
ncbi:hypothetical protein ACJMK2_036349 [Sinanodonta woodiana]|uniref:RRM domain-containing protein n=1 Tax=Sinanodonta woodiana TaxID=1069815 RepID=A0ABD3WIP7_SINWO